MAEDFNMDAVDNVEDQNSSGLLVDGTSEENPDNPIGLGDEVIKLNNTLAYSRTVYLPITYEEERRLPQLISNIIESGYKTLRTVQKVPGRRVELSFTLRDNKEEALRTGINILGKHRQVYDAQIDLLNVSLHGTPPEIPTRDLKGHMDKFGEVRNFYDKTEKLADREVNTGVRVFQYANINKLFPDFFKIDGIPRTIKVVWSNSQRFYTNELKTLLQNANQLPRQTRQGERYVHKTKQQQREEEPTTREKKNENDWQTVVSKNTRKKPTPQVNVTLKNQYQALEQMHNNEVQDPPENNENDATKNKNADAPQQNKETAKPQEEGKDEKSKPPQKQQNKEAAKPQDVGKDDNPKPQQKQPDKEAAKPQADGKDDNRKPQQENGNDDAPEQHQNNEKPQQQQNVSTEDTTKEIEMKEDKPPKRKMSPQKDEISTKVSKNETNWADDKIQPFRIIQEQLEPVEQSVEEGEIVETNQNPCKPHKPMINTAKAIDNLKHVKSLYQNLTQIEKQKEVTERVQKVMQAQETRKFSNEKVKDFRVISRDKCILGESALFTYGNLSEWKEAVIGAMYINHEKDNKSNQQNSKIKYCKFPTYLHTPATKLFHEKNTNDAKKRATANTWIKNFLDNCNKNISQQTKPDYQQKIKFLTDIYTKHALKHDFKY